jgi:hypothetical protein
MSNLTFFAIGFIVFWIWIFYEAWRAPLMRENEDGSYTTIRGEKKFSDLFKKRYIPSRKPKTQSDYEREHRK